MMASDEEDDFILTISDEDGPFHNETQESESASEAQSIKPAQGTKRKRKSGSVEKDSSEGAKKPKRSKTLQSRVAEDTESGEPDESWSGRSENDGGIDSDFEFQIGDVETGITEDFNAWGSGRGPQTLGDPVEKKGVNIDALIARRRKNMGQAAKLNDDEAGANSDMSENVEGGELGLERIPSSDGDHKEYIDETLAPDSFGMGARRGDEEALSDSLEEHSHESSEDESIAAPVPHPADEAKDVSSDPDDGDDDPEEQARRDAFFAPEEQFKIGPTISTPRTTFESMSLSRPILRGLASCAFTNPTPIQSKTIPVALSGRDVVGGAVTGSGKTAAFIIPILERLLYRRRRIPTSRVAVLMPTRELAVQCYTVAKKLASYTDITFVQLVGGLSLREQETVLRSRPDIIIATPGRFIDHMRNSLSFTIDTLEIMVLDEADRMLDDGFADELNEILTTIPRSRQTMLFSATMTTRVESLVRLGLNNPVRLVINPRTTTVGTLTQEFIRLRPGREEKRLAYLIHLCQTTYTSQTIVFFRQKALAHRIRILFSLLDLKAAELHGSMTQEQRLSSLTAFRTGAAHFLLATDVASRGLDIPNVSAVINYTAPQNTTIYLHRVGRTARAGRAGRSCTLAAEPDRKVVKEIVKAGKSQNAKVVSRAVDATVVDELYTRLSALETEIDAILKEEKEERALQGAEMQVRKGENLIVHEDQIKARPKRTWFESEKEKINSKKKGFEELNGAVGKERGKGKLSNKNKKRLDDGRERREGNVWKKGRGERGMVGGTQMKGKENGKQKVRGKLHVKGGKSKRK